MILAFFWIVLQNMSMCRWDSECISYINLLISYSTVLLVCSFIYCVFVNMFTIFFVKTLGGTSPETYLVVMLFCEFFALIALWVWLHIFRIYRQEKFLHAKDKGIRFYDVVLGILEFFLRMGVAIDLVAYGFFLFVWVYHILTGVALLDA